MVEFGHTSQFFPWSAEFTERVIAHSDAVLNALALQSLSAFRLTSDRTPEAYERYIEHIDQAGVFPYQVVSMRLTTFDRDAVEGDLRSLLRTFQVHEVEYLRERLAFGQVEGRDSARCAIGHVMHLRGLPYGCAPTVMTPPVGYRLFEAWLYHNVHYGNTPANSAQAEWLFALLTDWIDQHRIESINGEPFGRRPVVVVGASSQYAAVRAAARGWSDDHGDSRAVYRSPPHRPVREPVL